MKRIVSLLLAVLMIAAMVPAMVLATFAEGETTSNYVVYSEDFENLELKADSAAILNTLGWYVPTATADKNIATYSVAANGTNKSLRVSTVAHTYEQRFNESFLTLFDGDIMALVRKSDFTLSYDLTYRAGTTNADGYSAVIYNYNESGNTDTLKGLPTSYGIAAVRACGAGFNNVYYSVFDRSEMASVENIGNTTRIVNMCNNFVEPGKGSSLYKRIAETLGDTTYTEEEGDIMSGTVRMIDKTVSIKVEYSYNSGVTVYVNDVKVSEPNTARNNNKLDATTVWGDFVERTTGTALGLVTSADIVADIDNVQIVAKEIATPAYSSNKLPDLVITEINAYGYNRSYDADGTFAEYIEIYNPTDKPVDLTKYTLTQASTPQGTEAEKMPNQNPVKYSTSINLGDFLGTDTVGNGAYYELTSDLAKYDNVNNPTRFKHEKGNDVRYTKEGNNYVEDPNGVYCLIRYVDVWNSRYQKSNNNDPDLYDTNTLLNPGEVCLLFFIYDPGNRADLNKVWKWGTNAGSKSKEISETKSFRNVYGRTQGAYTGGFGLTEDVKVISINKFNLADGINCRYYLAKSQDNGGSTINYKDVFVGSPTHDQYLVSWCDWNTSIVTGKEYEGTDPNDADFGKAGIAQANFAAAYVYGVDASTDPRAGTLYSSHQKVGVSYSHVGRITEHQRIVLDHMYQKNASNKTPELMITEIVPRTNNLAGEDINAFSAIELTNTSTEALNLYEYAMVRTEEENYIPYGSGWTRYTMMKAGNPVTRGEGNGAYYYFVENTISNPDTCVLAPGESVVVWLLTDGTFQSYQNDEDFSFEYFRQYWVDNGNSQLAMKNTKGEYITKVIAVDANISTTNNIDNADRVFDAAAYYSALYGITRTDRNMKLSLRTKIKSENVISFAFLGTSGIHYKITGMEVPTPSGPAFGKILTRTFPANASIHYLAGAGPIKNCSALSDSLKVQTWASSSNGTDIATHVGIKAPRLGVLDNEELYIFRDRIFTSNTEGTETTYRYYDAANTQAYMLEGAVLDMSGNNPALRFDMAIPESVYYSLIGTYGDRAEIGIAIMESDRLGNKRTFTNEQMNAVINNGVDCQIISRNNGFVVISAWVAVADYNYSTSYTAIGYISVEMDDGTVVNTAAHGIVSRSLYEVATAALEDVKYEYSAEYPYFTEDGTYSRYDDTLRVKMLIYTA